MFRFLCALFPPLCLVSCRGLISTVTASSSVDVNGQLSITALVGQNVTLPCRAPTNAPIRAAEWSRPDQEPKYVFFYRDGQPDKAFQHPSFQNRVELADRQMKDGNLSVILKNVIRSDTGTYECRVKQVTAADTKRAVIKSEPISIVHLAVIQSRDPVGHRGDGQHVAGNVGLLMCLLLSAVTFLIYC